MKKSLFCLLCTLQILLSESKAQNIAINTDGSVPDASSMLDIASTTKGFLAPRMTTTQQNAIALPAKGLLIYNTTDNTFKVNTGTSGAPVWTTLSTTSSSWLLTGNSGTSTSTNFLGTTDNVNLNFRTNNLQRMVIDTSGRFGLGTSTFNATNPEKLLIDAGTTSSINVISGKGSIDNYLQLNIQNTSSGINASSDVVATANNGSETTNFVDMGINGSGNTSNIMGSANDSYLYNMGNNFLVGTGSASKSLVFMTGGTSQSINERMRIDGTGNVGIGVSSPAYKLQVSAASNPLHLAGLQTGTNTDSILTVSNGVVKRLSPSALITSSSNAWGLTGNASTNSSTNFAGTSDNVNMNFRTNNVQRMMIDKTGPIGIGVTNPANPLVVKDTMEIRRTGANISQLLFANTSGTGDFRIAGDGGDIFWQGGGGRNLQMGAYWGVILAGDRQTSTLPTFSVGVTNTGVLVQAQRDVSVPLAIQGNSATQSANLTEWRNSAGAVMNIVKSNGSMALGATTFNATNPEKLLVDAGTTSSINVISGKGSIDNYLQLNIQNNSAGTFASSDLVATANNGNETTNYVDMGINGSNYSGGVMGGANDSYLYNVGQNFLIGNASASKSLVFMTGGTSQTTNERMRIDGSGNIGIGTVSPNSTLSVTGSQSVSFRSGTGAYTVLSTDYVVINTGGSTPTWTLPLANTCSGRVYYLVNHGTTSVTISQAITTASGTTSTTLANTAGSNTYEIISDGSVWRKMN